MNRTEISTERLLPAMAQHVLTHGLSAASLRPLAAAAGTSDRMLIYHFGNKELLIAQLLSYIADTYATALDAAFGDELPQSRQECFDRILAYSSRAEIEPFIALWWDIVAGSARGVAGYAEAARAIMHKLLDWLESHMPAGDPDPAGGARYILTLIEGSQMLQAVGCDAIAADGVRAAKL